LLCFLFLCIAWSTSGTLGKRQVMRPRGHGGKTTTTAVERVLLDGRSSVLRDNRNSLQAIVFWLRASSGSCIASPTLETICSMNCAHASVSASSETRKIIIFGAKVGRSSSSLLRTSSLIAHHLTHLHPSKAKPSHIHIPLQYSGLADLNKQRGTHTERDICLIRAALLRT